MQQRKKNEVGTALMLLGLGVLFGDEEFSNTSKFSTFLEEFWKPEMSSPMKPETPKYVYGIKGLASILGVSQPTAQKIVNSGKIEAATSRLGRKLIFDSQLALELATKK